MNEVSQMLTPLNCNQNFTVYLLGRPLQLIILKLKFTSLPTSSSGLSTNISSFSVYSLPFESHGATSNCVTNMIIVKLL